MAAFRGSKPMVGGNGVAPEVDPALYRNLVEMIPLMESFMVRGRVVVFLNLVLVCFCCVDSGLRLAVDGSGEQELEH